MLREDLQEALKAAGHDTLRVSEFGQERADDEAILKAAIGSDRVLLTLDGHFGDWAVLPLSEHCGVIRIKVHPTSTKNITTLLLPFLAKHRSADFRNKLVILSAHRARWITTSTKL